MESCLHTRTVLMKMQRVGYPVRLCCILVLTRSDSRSANTLIRVTTLSPRLASLLRPLLALLFPIQRSEPCSCHCVDSLLLSLHRTAFRMHRNGHGTGHQSSSISPTNSTSPVNRESSLSHSEIRGDEDRAQGSEPAVDEASNSKCSDGR
jgi:hypothetical protein